MHIEDKAGVLKQVSELLSANRLVDAASYIRQAYPFEPVEKSTRKYTPRQMTQVFNRDGFIDRYRGTRLVYPPALRLISMALPERFPYHKNGKMTVGHFAYWELFPSIDHIVPVAHGGKDEEANWVCCSMLTNQIKANWTLEELEWELKPPGDLTKWDGLLNWFIAQMRDESVRLAAPKYCRDWLSAAQACSF